MANKGKFFSWFGKGKKQEQDNTETEVSTEPAAHLSADQPDADSSPTTDTVHQPTEPVQTAPSSDAGVANDPLPAAKVDAAKVDGAKVDAAKVDAAKVDAAKVAISEPAAVETTSALSDDNGPAGDDNDSSGSVVANQEQGEITKGGFFSRFKKDKTNDISGDSPDPTLSPAKPASISEPDPIPDADDLQPVEALVESSESPEDSQATAKLGFFARLKQSLSKTKVNLGSGLVSLFRGKKIDDELFEELETQLLMADVGVETTLKLVASLTAQADRKQLKDGEALYELLKEEIVGLLSKVDQPLVIENHQGPFVILMVGVNGVGKTTTIGKMAKQFQRQGKSVMLAAGDTFRAAAVEQLTVWGDRNDIPVIAQHTGADSASVIFDAIQAAKARKIDVLIADTAGRLQNKDHLMEELKKVVRVMKKLDDTAPHEVMLTLDAGTGQNGLSQVKLFSEAVGLTGLTISKLDGTAKGGVILSIADQLSVPIRYIGVGEGIDDLRTFNSKDFVDALFAQDDA